MPFDIVIAVNISDMPRNVLYMERFPPLWGQAGGQDEGRAWLGSNVGEGKGY